MRTLFTFALLSAIAFSGVAVGQEETDQISVVAVEATETSDETPASIVDLGPAPSDEEIDTARQDIENETSIVEEGVATVTVAGDQFLDQGVTYPENIIFQDCCCQSGMIAPVVYQSPLIDGVVEGASEISLDGSVENAVNVDPIADASSVVESPITEAAPIYTDGGVVTEGSPIVEGEPIVVQGDSVVSGSPSCGCNQGAVPAAIPTEGLISSSAPAVSYQSAPVATFSSPAPVVAAPCCPQARRGFFRRLMGR